MKDIESRWSGFIFDLSFDICKDVFLVYDYNFSYTENDVICYYVEICYYDWRNDSMEKFITYL
jgi:hypothetical protein